MFKLGDRVAYSRVFLRDTGQITGWAPFARGEVTEIVFREPQFVRINWDSPDGHTSSVRSSNLVREDRIHLELA